MTLPAFVHAAPLTNLDSIARSRAALVQHFARPGEPDLPEKFVQLYPHQWAALGEVISDFLEDKKVVFLDAPTGAGKTLVAELVRRSLGVQSLYSCTTKS